MTESWSLAQRFLSLYVKHGPSSCFVNWEGTYALLRLGFALFLTWTGARGYSAVAIFFASLIALDILMFNTAVVFVTGGYVNIFRSMALTMIGYVTLAIALAPGWILLRFQNDGSTWERIVSGIYQSVRTLTTAGPDAERLDAPEKVFASFEMFVGIYFLSVIVAGYLSSPNGDSAK